MDFKLFYQNLPDKLEKRKIRNNIISTCRIQHSTFYSWLYRQKIPALAQEKISEILGKPIEDLFPEDESLI